MLGFSTVESDHYPIIPTPVRCEEDDDDRPAISPPPPPPTASTRGIQDRVRTVLRLSPSAHLFVLSHGPMIAGVKVNGVEIDREQWGLLIADGLPILSWAEVHPSAQDAFARPVIKPDATTDLLVKSTLGGADGSLLNASLVRLAWNLGRLPNEDEIRAVETYLKAEAAKL